jgi:hypothetical protein
MPPSKIGNSGDSILNYWHLSFSVPVFGVAERGERNSPFSPGIGHQGNIFVTVPAWPIEKIYCRKNKEFLEHHRGKTISKNYLKSAMSG